MPPRYSQDDPAAREVELVLDGYTISTGLFALGRVGREYVMRDRHGRRVALPCTAGPKALLEAWRAFRSQAPRRAGQPTDMAGPVQTDRLPEAGQS